MNTMRANKKLSLHGFTLLELLITMAMIAIVGALAAPSFDNSISRNNVQSMCDCEDYVYQLGVD